MVAILPATPMVRTTAPRSGQRATIWRGLLYVPGDGHRAPGVRPARLDTVRVEQYSRRGPTLGTRRVLVISGPPRLARSISELLSRPPAYTTVEHAGPRADLLDYQRLTRPLRNVEDVDRDFTVARSPKTRAMTARCVHCGRFEACHCDKR